MQVRGRTALVAFALSLGLMASAPATALAQGVDPDFARILKEALHPPDERPAQAEAAPDAAMHPAPETVAQLALWAVASGDNAGLPFLIVDKETARVFVYDASGAPVGSAPVLLGSAPGDDSVPGIGDRPLNKIKPHERTTPAGRFIAGFGPAIGQGETFWIDFGTALALHPVVTTNPKERRLRRLRSETIADNRITYGCVNVAGWFYEDVVRKTFAGTKGVAYVLPEEKTLAEVLPGFWGAVRTAGLDLDRDPSAPDEAELSADGGAN